MEGEHAFIYGLPEFNKEKIKKADFIANPGCFATAISLAIFSKTYVGLQHIRQYPLCILIYNRQCQRKK